MKKKHMEPDASDAQSANPVDMDEMENTAAEETAQAPAEEPAVDPVAAAKAEAAEWQDKFLRSQADYQNYRKRTAREMADARRIGVVEAIEAFLPLFDNFQMALTAVEKSDNVVAIKQGLSMIADAYAKTLDELGVKKFESVGKPFDPTRHEAIAHEPSDSVAEGDVSREWNSGYQMGERILRPARVVVSSGPAKVAE